MSAEARAKAIAWAKRVASDPATVFLDTETTGRERDARIVDLAIVAMDGTVLYSLLVNPGVAIPPEASAVHGITDRAVEKLWDFGSWASEIAMCLHGRQILVYNVGYDIPVLENELKRCGFDPPAWRPECAMLAYADFDGTPGNYPGSFKWHRLEDAARRFGIAPGGHRALADARVCRELVLAMAAADTEAPAVPEPGALPGFETVATKVDQTRWTR